MINLVLEEAGSSGVLTAGTLDTLLYTTYVFGSMPTKLRIVASQTQSIFPTPL